MELSRKLGQLEHGERRLDEGTNRDGQFLAALSAHRPGRRGQPAELRTGAFLAAVEVLGEVPAGDDAVGIPSGRHLLGDDRRGDPEERSQRGQLWHRELSGGEMGRSPA